MKLAIFDVDGTLLDNLASEDACYSQALSEVLGLPSLDDDWAAYQHVSDAGIATEAYRAAYGVDPAPDLVSATSARFVELLRLAERVERTPQVPGAAELFVALPQHGWAVAIATGAWRSAAEFKLSVASLPWQGVPIATAEDGPARTDIVNRARAHAEAYHKVSRFERVVSIGDGVWDAQATQMLDLPFVGVGEGERAARLRRAGVSILLSDFTELATTLQALERAATPLSAVP